MGPKTGGPNCEGRRRVERLLWALLVRRVRSPVPAAESTERECYVDDTPGTLRLSEHKGTNWSTRAIPTAGALGALRRLALTPQSPALRAGAPAGRRERRDFHCDQDGRASESDWLWRVRNYRVVRVSPSRVPPLCHRIRSKLQTRRSMIRNCTDTTVSCSYRVFVIYSYTVQPYADPMPHAAGAARPDPALEVGWELDRTDRNTQTAKL
jgi:hypothetical protein